MTTPIEALLSATGPATQWLEDNAEAIDRAFAEMEAEDEEEMR
jgi:hypothetical protein